MTRAEKTYDVLVVGSGFAGMAAALFAARRGLSVAQAGAVGGIDFSTGFLDLLGVHPVAEGRRRDDPWAALRELREVRPEHPYARLPEADIAAALGEFTDFLAAQGLPYIGHEGRNAPAPTPAGTVKRTWRMPLSAWNGSLALEAGAPTLLVDFHGLKGFSAAQLVQTLEPRWPGLRAARLDFPGSSGELYPEHMAWTLADPKRRAELAASLARAAEAGAAAGGVEYAGFPAVLGLREPMAVIADLERHTGLKLFEIPTLPPSIAGPRLRAAFDRGLPPLGVRTFTQKLVLSAETIPDAAGGGFVFRLGPKSHPVGLRARAAILATGRFFGKGLAADRHGVREPVFGLPVHQPGARADWHREEFFDVRGHALNRAGLEIDDRFRPLGDSGGPLCERLFAAGAILAHQDWMRQKCGAGLAVATAYAAVRGAVRALRGG